MKRVVAETMLIYTFIHSAQVECFPTKGKYAHAYVDTYIDTNMLEGTTIKCIGTEGGNCYTTYTFMLHTRVYTYHGVRSKRRRGAAYPHPVCQNFCKMMLKSLKGEGCLPVLKGRREGLS